MPTDNGVLADKNIYYYLKTPGNVPTQNKKSFFYSSTAL